MLLGTFLLGCVPGGYYLWWSRRMAPRPSDDPKASLKDGAGVVGAFPGSQHLAVRPRPRCHFRGLGTRVRRLDAGRRLVPGRRGPRRGRLREPPRRLGLAQLAARPCDRAGFGVGTRVRGAPAAHPNREAQHENDQHGHQEKEDSEAEVEGQAHSPPPGPCCGCGPCDFTRTRPSCTRLTTRRPSSSKMSPLASPRAP